MFMIMVRYMWHMMLRKFFPHDMRKPEKKNFKKPDVLFDYPFKGEGIYGNTANLFIGRNEFRKIILSPGWRWTAHAKPMMKTELCMYTHLGYLVSGEAKMQMKDGTVLDFHPGDATSAPAEHDFWTVGDAPLVIIEQSAPEGLKLLPLKKMFATTDEKQSAGGAGIASVDLSGFVWHKAVLPPGFRWTAADPSALGAARLDDASHIVAVLGGGRGVFTMADSTDVSVGPDDVVYLPPCKEMRVVGDEPLVFLQQTATM